MREVEQKKEEQEAGEMALKLGAAMRDPLQRAVRPTLPAPPGHQAGPPLHTPTSCTLLPSLCLPGDPRHQSPLGVRGPSGASLP